MNRSFAVPAADVTEQGPHDRSGDRHGHFALVYDSADDRLDALVPFLGAGLERGERCIYFQDADARNDLLAALQATDVDVEAALDDGRLDVRDAAEIYFTDDRFDPDRVSDDLTELAAETAADDAYDGLTVAGDVTPCLRAGTDAEDLLRYESVVDSFYARDDRRGLCLYDSAALPQDFLQGLLRTHPHLVFDAATVRSEHYAGPDGFSADEFNPASVDRLADYRTRADLERRLDRYRAVVRAFATAGERLGEASKSAVGEPAVEFVARAVGPATCGFWKYDQESKEFELDASLAEDAVGRSAPELLDPLATVAWDCFIDDETRVLERAADPVARLPDDSPVESVVAVPVTNYGVLLAASTDPGAFGDDAVDIVRAAAVQVENALKRLRTQERLTQRNQDLDREAAAVARLERSEGLLRRVAALVVEARTVDELRDASCEAVASLDPVRFAWVGEFDRAADSVVPQSWTGDAERYLDAVSLDCADVDGAEPAVRASQTTDRVVVSDVVGELSRGDWRREALARDVHSVAAVPLVYDDICHGVLAAYAEEATAFDDRLGSVLQDAAGLLGFGVVAVERKHALVTNETVRLEFEIRDPQSPILKLSHRADCRVELDGVVPKSGDVTVGYFSFEGVPVDEFVEYVRDTVAASDYRLLEEGTRRGRVQVELRAPFLATELARHGAVLESMVAEGGTGWIEVVSPGSVPVRDVVEFVQRVIPRADLVSKRTEASPDASGADTDHIVDRLTDRQREIIRTAYHAGYFEDPRQSRGEAIAESLDIASPTFHQHRRVAINKILASVFDGE